MSGIRANRRGAAILIFWICCARVASGSDDTLAQAKNLYATAEHAAEALAVLDRLQADASPKDSIAIAEYRAFCLLALDRRDEARHTIAAMFSDDPRYLPPEDLASPRIQSVFRETRKEVLPAIVRERYAAAKAAFERKDPQAGPRFEDVLALLDDPDVQGMPTLGDLRIVVSAFRDLTSAIAATPPPVVDRAHDPPVPNEIRATAVPDLNIVYTSADADVVPAAAVAQRIPPWTPQARDAVQEFKGTLELLVDERGMVTSATLSASVHPVYDAALLKAVRQWKFIPATKQGIPVRYLKVIGIHLRPAAPTAR